MIYETYLVALTTFLLQARIQSIIPKTTQFISLHTRWRMLYNFAAQRMKRLP